MDTWQKTNEDLDAVFKEIHAIYEEVPSVKDADQARLKVARDKAVAIHYRRIALNMANLHLKRVYKAYTDRGLIPPYFGKAPKMPSSAEFDEMVAAQNARYKAFDDAHAAYIKKNMRRSEKLSSAEYTFTVTKNADYSITTVLTQVSTGKTKTFFQASGSADGAHEHMLSLTDDLCSQWFNERPPKKEKKK